MMLSSEKFYRILLHLGLIPSIGPSVVERLVLSIGEENLFDLYNYSIADITRAQIHPNEAQKIFFGLKDFKILETELNLLNKHNIRFIHRYADEYPLLLRSIHLPPIGLYILGTFPSQYQTAIAAVGSRNAQEEGKLIVDFLFKNVARDGWPLISGGAIGIDSMVHRCALSVQGYTMAVLGSGLLSPYPRENISLFDEIVASGGSVISSYPLQMKGLPGNFPARNRIIAGIASCCIVIQAAKKSGALITAYSALAEGRAVGAVPGSILNPFSEGSNQLIFEGASIIRSEEDVSLLVGEKIKNISQTIETPKKRDPLTENDDLTGHMKQIIIFCFKQPRSFDEILDHVLCSSTELHDLLWQLQIKNHIEELFIGKWVTVEKK